MYEGLPHHECHCMIAKHTSTLNDMMCIYVSAGVSSGVSGINAVGYGSGSDAHMVCHLQMYDTHNIEQQHNSRHTKKFDTQRDQHKSTLFVSYFKLLMVPHLK